MTRINHKYRSQPLAPQPAKQAAQTAREDRQYTKLRATYLEQNPFCVLCDKTANQVHHLLRGANRRRGLLNTDTWLGCCSTECHDEIEKLTWGMQLLLKQHAVRTTIERLRK